MHYTIQQEIARGHYEDVMREARQHRLAAIATGETEPKRHFTKLTSLLQRRVPRHRPVPAT